MLRVRMSYRPPDDRETISEGTSSIIINNHRSNKRNASTATTTINTHIALSYACGVLLLLLLLLHLLHTAIHQITSINNRRGTITSKSFYPSPHPTVTNAIVTISVERKLAGRFFTIQGTQDITLTLVMHGARLELFATHV